MKKKYCLIVDEDGVMRAYWIPFENTFAERNLRIVGYHASLPDCKRI